MDTITYTALAKKIHPDLNPHDPDATNKMKQLNSVKNNSAAVHNLAVKWGIVQSTIKSEYNRTYDAFANFHKRYEQPEPRRTWLINPVDFVGRVIKFKKDNKHYSGIIFNYDSNYDNYTVTFWIFVNNDSIFKIQTADAKNMKFIGRVDASYLRNVCEKIYVSDPYFKIKYGVEKNKSYLNEHLYIKVDGCHGVRRVLRTTNERVVFEYYGGEKQVNITKIKEFFRI